MSNFPDHVPTKQGELEQQNFDESTLLNKISPPSPTNQRALPGAALLSPQARPGSRILSPEPFNATGGAGGFKNTITSPGTNSSMALLSPPGSRYAFEPQDTVTMSPLLTGSNSNFNSLSNNRPMSAQDFNYNSDAFLNSNNRPLSAQGFNIPERPLSSMEVDSMTFKNDVANLVNWINTLNSNQHRTVVDNLLSTFPDEILNYTKSKLESFSFANNSNARFAASPSQANFIYQPTTQEPLTLDAVLNSSGQPQQQSQQQNQPWSPANIQRALSPNFTSTFDRSFLQDIGSNRPRSADPYSSKLFNRNNNMNNNNSSSSNTNNSNNNNYGIPNDWDSTMTPSKSRSSRFDSQENEYQPQSQPSSSSQQKSSSSSNNFENRSYDITNLAQQLTQTPIKLNDYNNSNALKLSALSTINSRAQLDSNKKRTHQVTQQQLPPHSDERCRSVNNTTTNSNTTSSHPNAFNNTVAGQRYFNINDETNNTNRNSMSVPPPQRVNYYENISMSPSVNRVLNKQRSQTRMNNDQSPPQQQIDGLSRFASLNHATKNLSLNEEFSTPYKQQIVKEQGTPRSPAINPKQITSVKLLNDIPAWLKTLRLHKYTAALQDVFWKELIYFDDQQLEQKGVSAMGARGKLLKAFEIVKQSYERGDIKE